MCARCDEQTDRVKATIWPEISAFLADLTARGLATPEPAVVGIEEARRRNLAYFEAIAAPRAEVKAVSVETLSALQGHELTVKVAVPHGAKAGCAAMLYCHGGGYAFGDLETHDHVIRHLAATTGMVVFGVHYRRTPEHAYPAQIEDTLTTYAAMRGAQWQKKFGIDPDRIAFVGDSAGAHLCMGAMLTLRALGLPQPKAAGLIYGMYARRFDTWSHHAYGDGSYGLSSDRMRWFWDQLMQGRGDSYDPIAEPLNADLSGLPPLALFGAECDCLLEDTLDFRENCKRQDHPHTMDLLKGMPHAVIHLCSVQDAAREAMNLLSSRLQKLV
ncbi:MAG: alpha/beta hydrolase [Beijerinckiaceae bacterium]